MKKLSGFLAIGAVAAIVASCSANLYRMDLQMRQPSASGYDLGGKEMGVVYIAPAKDTTFAKSLAEGFAAALEEDYFSGEAAVDVYTMTATQAADYASRDTMLNLVMDTEKDVIFLIECQKDADDNARMRLHVYDSMGKADTVRTFGGIIPLNGQNNIADAKLSGQKASIKFLSNWRPEMFYFYSYDTPEWIGALNAAFSFKWHEAMNRWLKIVETAKSYKAAYCAFNLATTAYILGDYSLCERWLVIAEQAGTNQYTSALRTKLSGKMGAD